MLDKKALARPYAKGAFLYAVENNAVSHFAKMLEVLAWIAKNEWVVKTKLLSTPLMTTASLTEFFKAVSGDLIDEAGENFIKMLAENKKIHCLPEIAALFDELHQAYEKETSVVVSSPMALSEAQQEKLQQALEKRLGLAISMSFELDEKLIGGAALRLGSQVIDGSVKGRLAKISETISV